MTYSVNDVEVMDQNRDETIRGYQDALKKSDNILDAGARLVAQKNIRDDAAEMLDYVSGYRERVVSNDGIFGLVLGGTFIGPLVSSFLVAIPAVAALPAALPLLACVGIGLVAGRWIGRTIGKAFANDYEKDSADFKQRLSGVIEDATIALGKTVEAGLNGADTSFKSTLAQNADLSAEFANAGTKQVNTTAVAANVPSEKLKI